LLVAAVTLSSDGHRDVNCSSLLEVTTATETMTLAARRY
jgi:hypothetical protein